MAMLEILKLLKFNAESLGIFCGFVSDYTQYNHGVQSCSVLRFLNPAGIPSFPPFLALPS